MQLSDLNASGACELLDVNAAPSVPAGADSKTALSHQNEALFRDAFDHAAVAMAIVGIDGCFIHVNSALCNLLGFTQTELQGHSFDLITHNQDVAPSDDLLRHFQSCQSRSAQLEKRYVHRSGRELYVALTISLVQDAEGRPLHFVTHVQDITERRRGQWLEEDRRQVLEMVAQDQPLPSVLNQLVRLVERQMAGTSACVMLLQDGTIRPFAPSMPKVLSDAIGRRPVSFASRLATTPMGRGAAPLVADVQTHAAWEGLGDAARSAGYPCCWAATVAGVDAVPLAIFVVFSPEGRPPDSAECAVLETAVRLTIIAIEHHQTTRQLAHLVRHDALTGLPNRILFEDRLHHSLLTAHRKGKPLALLAMDLNRFKEVNDTYGHQAGDSLLQQFAHRLRSKLRESDTLARVGGDEFMLILSEITGHEGAELVAGRLCEALSASPFEVGGHSLPATCSIGIAVYPNDGEDASMLQRAADAAMYRAKQQTRR